MQGVVLYVRTFHHEQAVVWNQGQGTEDWGCDVRSAEGQAGQAAI